MEIETDIGIEGNPGDTTNFYISFEETKSFNMYENEVTVKHILKWLAKYKVNESELGESGAENEWEYRVCVYRPFRG